MGQSRNHDTLAHDLAHQATCLLDARRKRPAGWPVRKDRVARGILALSLRFGGLDFADGSSVTREHLQKREYHHLFPKAWLARKNVSERGADIALNCALVTWKTNRTLADKPPSEYISERTALSSLGEGEIQHRLDSHLVPYAELMSDDYGKFCERRADMLHELMERLCAGKPV